jgi:hypothetical protein
MTPLLTIAAAVESSNFADLAGCIDYRHAVGYKTTFRNVDSAAALREMTIIVCASVSSLTIHLGDGFRTTDSLQRFLELEIEFAGDP